MNNTCKMMGGVALGTAAVRCWRLHLSCFTVQPQDVVMQIYIQQGYAYVRAVHVLCVFAVLYDD